MNNNLKRYRQTSLFESFAFSKRPKIDSNMNENADNQGLALEENITAPQIESFESLNTSQASEDSNMNENTDNQEFSQEEKIISSQIDSLDLKNVCQAAEDSIIIKHENHEVKQGNSAVHEMEPTDDNYRNSDDLFPSDPSSHQDSGPSSSYSGELFLDSESQTATTEATDFTPDSDEEDALSVVNTKPLCSLPLPKMEPSENHIFLFSPHIRPGDAPRPYPSSYRDKWDTDHVRMPCSPLNKYPVENAFGETRIESRWSLICRSLRTEITSSYELEEAIMKYNTQYIGKWSFEGLHAFINRELNEAERDHFFEDVLPAMVKMALDLPNICTQPVPLLKKNKDFYLTMSQKQIGCLLLNAFFCTFPRRSSTRKLNRKVPHEYSYYPDINFNRLFFGTKKHVSSRTIEKLKCLMNYFRRIASVEPSGTVTFHRQCIKTHSFPLWHTSTRGIRNAVIKSAGVIETDGQGMLQVDFANKYIGGGVLGQGCVQEEIRFIICPELIVSRLFVECLDNNEAVIITGVEQYSKYSGYSNTFKWEGDFKDETPRDSWGRRYTEVVAIDATHFRNTNEQFRFHSIKRELNKAYCGFYEDGPPVHLSAIATGNWGCGAFKGSADLKFLLQLMAASEAGRSLVYFTFGDKKLKSEMKKMHEFLSDKNLAVGDVWRLLLSFVSNTNLSVKKAPDLYEFIYDQFVIKKISKEQVNATSKDEFFEDSDKKAMSKLFDDLDFCSELTNTEDGT